MSDWFQWSGSTVDASNAVVGRRRAITGGDESNKPGPTTRLADLGRQRHALASALRIPAE
jgi:hypothetical protein